MSDFNANLQHLSTQSIQTSIAQSQVAAPAVPGQQPQQSGLLGSDVAMLSTGGPSYMQTIEALMFAQVTAEAQPSDSLSNLRTLLDGSEGDTRSDNSLATNYGKNNNVGVFNPTFYSPSGVGGRSSGNGNYGGYGSGGRTGGGNVATSGIDRMIEMMIAQSLGKSIPGNQLPAISQDAVTLVGRSPEEKANAFHELTGALVQLLAEQINGSAEQAAEAPPSLKKLLSELAEQQQQPDHEPLNQSQLQALMDEVAVMQLIQGTRKNDNAAASNPMANKILDLMQNLLGAQSGGSVSASQMQSLLGALSKNFSGDSSSPAAAMMQQMLPEMMAMLQADSAPIPGAIIPKNANATPRLAPFKASIGSDGGAKGTVGSGQSRSFQVQSGQNGSVTLLDGSKNKDLAGGFGISASLGRNPAGEDSLQVGTFSWNAGNDAVALNAQGQAAVTSDGGATWVPLPTQGVSTYNPGNGGPTLQYNPDAKTVSFTASGSNKDNIAATIHAQDSGVSFDIEGDNGVDAGGQLASALS